MLHRHPHAHEQAGHERVPFICEDAAGQQRPGRGVDLGRDVVQHAPMRVPGLALEADLDRDARQVPEGPALLDEALLDQEHLLLADVEIDVDRIDPDDRGELGRAADADEGAHIHQMVGDDPVEGRQHLGIAEIDRGEIEIGLRLRDRGRGLVEPGLGVLDMGLRGEFLLPQRRLALVLGLRVGAGRHLRRQAALRLFELRLVGVALEREERRALPDAGAVRVGDGVEEALDAGFEIDGREGLGVAGQLEIADHRALDRLRHRDGGRRGRNVMVRLVAAGHDAEQPGREAAQPRAFLYRSPG
ncbi:hypothetical protein AEGHOMDF_4987 [Methylobacterium soli]|nr:hypothetical protein AEGHOMDF_4987 [Methylobacterium soli]